MQAKTGTSGRGSVGRESEFKPEGPGFHLLARQGQGQGFFLSIFDSEFFVCFVLFYCAPDGVRTRVTDVIKSLVPRSTN